MASRIVSVRTDWGVVGAPPTVVSAWMGAAIRAISALSGPTRLSCGVWPDEGAANYPEPVTAWAWMAIGRMQADATISAVAVRIHRETLVECVINRTFPARGASDGGPARLAPCGAMAAPIRTFVL